MHIEKNSLDLLVLHYHYLEKCHSIGSLNTKPSIVKINNIYLDFL